MSARRRTVQVGLGLRSWMYSVALAHTYRETCELVGLCDANAGRLAQRLDWARSQGLEPETCDPAGFEALLARVRPDVVVVTTPDCDHDHYACLAMEAGCDVVLEKPMTTDAERCERILATRRRTGRQVRVTFNYRYSPVRAQVKQLLSDGVVGEVLSVDFQWLLDIRHGADYFRRWHRSRRHSGGLLVHKATHHFDLVNWWLDSQPESVFARGRRGFYTPEQAARYGLDGRGSRCLDCVCAERCPFRLDLAGSPLLKATYLEHEAHDGYHRDQCVFDDAIDIEDAMQVVATYRSGAHLSYSLTAFTPWEGYRIAFNGTRGRLEHELVESVAVAGNEPTGEHATIRLCPHFEPAVDVPVEEGEGGHGGGDRLLLEDLFAPDPPDDPLGRAADHRAGAWSILTGIAANRSLENERPVRPADLVSSL